MQSRSPLHPASCQRWMAATTCPHPHQQQSTTYRAAAIHPKSLKNIDWALLDHVLTSHGFVRRSDITGYGQLPSDTGASAGSPTWTTTVSSRNALTFVQQTRAAELTTDNIHVFRRAQPHVSIKQPPQRQVVPEGRQQATFQDKALEHMLLQKQQRNGSQNVLLQHNLLQSGKTQQVVQHLHVAVAAGDAGRRSQQGLQLSHSRFHQQQQHPQRLDARPATAGCRSSTHPVETAAPEGVGPRMMSFADQAVSSQAAADSYITLWFQKQAVQQQLAQLQEQEQDLQSHMRLLVQQLLQQQGGSKAQVHLLLQHTLLKIQQSQQQGVTSPDADDGDSTYSVRPAKRRRQSDTGSSSAGPSAEEEEDQQAETDIAAALLGLRKHDLLPQ